MKRHWQRAGFVLLALAFISLVAHRFLIAFTPWWVDLLLMGVSALVLLFLLVESRATSPKRSGENK